MLKFKTVLRAWNVKNGNGQATPDNLQQFSLNNLSFTIVEKENIGFSV